MEVSAIKNMKYVFCSTLKSTKAVNLTPDFVLEGVLTMNTGIATNQNRSEMKGNHSCGNKTGKNKSLAIFSYQEVLVDQGN